MIVAARDSRAIAQRRQDTLVTLLSAGRSNGCCRPRQSFERLLRGEGEGGALLPSSLLRACQGANSRPQALQRTPAMLFSPALLSRDTHRVHNLQPSVNFSDMHWAGVTLALTASPRSPQMQSCIGPKVDLNSGNLIRRDDQAVGFKKVNQP